MTKTRSQLHRERARWKAGDTVTVPDYRPLVVENLTMDEKAGSYAATPIYPPGTWWQPIATAPKDGTVILGAHLWPSGNADIYTCKFVDEWTDDMGDAVELPPTHWLPLPPPPTTE